MNSKHNQSILQGLLIAAFFAAVWPAHVFAQDLAGTVNNLTSKELVNIPDLIGAVFYIGGTAFVGAGLLKAKQYSDNPVQTKLGEAVGRLGIGGSMLALPYVANVAVQSFAFGNTAAPYTTFGAVQ